jgi:hypothetical protein
VFFNKLKPITYKKTSICLPSKLELAFQGFIFEVLISFLVLAKGEFYGPILVPVPSKWYWVKSQSQELEPELLSLTIQTKELANIDLYGFCTCHHFLLNPSSNACHN